MVEASHVALAAEGATFSKAEVNIGIIPTFGGTQRLPRNVGRKAALELILTGREYDASEAARLGKVNPSCPPPTCSTPHIPSPPNLPRSHHYISRQR